MAINLKDPNRFKEFTDEFNRKYPYHTEMEWRVARAITAAEGDNPDGKTGSLLNEDEVWWQRRIPQARAAIEAMRNPTKAMLDAGAMFNEYSAEAAWQEMIDAALKDGQ